MAWKDILNPVLDRDRVGLVCDFDGTLSPIVTDHTKAKITPKNKQLLEKLQKQLTVVAIVTGRRVDDVWGRVGLATVEYFGNHGLERLVKGKAQLVQEAQKIRSALEDIQKRVLLEPGMAFDDKGASLALHYRQHGMPDKVPAAYLPTLERIAEEYGLKVYQGRMIFEFRPVTNIHKGTALQQLVIEHKLKGVIYLGDDTTDIDALKVGRQLRDSDIIQFAGLVVKSDEMPADLCDYADAFLSGTDEVEAVLTWLLEAKASSI